MLSTHYKNKLLGDETLSRFFFEYNNENFVFDSILSLKD